MEPKTITFALKIMILAHFRPTLANWVQHNGHKLHIFGPGPPKGMNGGPTHGPTLYGANWGGFSPK